MQKERSNKQRRAALAAEINYALLTAHFSMVVRQPQRGTNLEGPRRQPDFDGHGRIAWDCDTG
jgi:hypothetical protein